MLDVNKDQMSSASPDNETNDARRKNEVEKIEAGLKKTSDSKEDETNGESDVVVPENKTEEVSDVKEREEGVKDKAITPNLTPGTDQEKEEVQLSLVETGEKDDVKADIDKQDKEASKN